MCYYYKYELDNSYCITQTLITNNSRMKILTFSLLIFLFTTISAYSQIPQLQWVKQIGGGYEDNVTSVAVDPSGNVYSTGYFYGTVDFDPSAGIFNLTSEKITSVFISKLDPSGNFVWAKEIEGNGYSYASSIVLDNVGNLYITGYFYGTVDFDPDTSVYNLITVNRNDNASVYYAKFDSNGTFIWAVNIEGNQYSTRGKSITVDKSGNVYGIGNFQGTVDFNPGKEVFNLTGYDGPDIFVIKFDSSGDFTWAKQFESDGTPSFCSGNSISVDDFGNVYTTGIFNGTTDFDPGKGVYNIVPFERGSLHIFISKLDKFGDFKWATTVSGYDSDQGNFIKTDISGNVYVTGGFTGTADFAPGTTIVTLSSTGGMDIFVLKLDSSGKLQWAKKMGGGGTDVGTSLAIDGSGNVYTVGLFSTIADFDPSSAISTLISSMGATNPYNSSLGTYDVFISKLDAQGNFAWAKQLGTSKVVSISVEVSGTIYVAGTMVGVGDFDPGAGLHYIVSEGETDIYILKIKQVPVDVQEFEEPTDFSVSPNPSSNSITVNFGKQITNGRIKLINLLGQTAIEESDVNAHSLTLDINQQPKGMYFLEMSEGGNIERVKIIKE